MTVKAISFQLNKNLGMCNILKMSEKKAISEVDESMSHIVRWDILVVLISSLAQFLSFSRGLQLTYQPHKDIRELSTATSPFRYVCRAS